MAAYVQANLVLGDQAVRDQLRQRALNGKVHLLPKVLGHVLLARLVEPLL